MLPFLNLTLPEIAPVAPELPANTELSAGFADPEGSFAALLQLAVPVLYRGSPTGESLPAGGNALPVADTTAAARAVPTGAVPVSAVPVSAISASAVAADAVPAGRPGVVDEHDVPLPLLAPQRPRNVRPGGAVQPVPADGAMQHVSRTAEPVSVPARIGQEVARYADTATEKITPTPPQHPALQREPQLVAERYRHAPQVSPETGRVATAPVPLDSEPGISARLPVAPASPRTPVIAESAPRPAIHEVAPTAMRSAPEPLQPQAELPRLDVTSRVAEVSTTPVITTGQDAAAPAQHVSAANTRVSLALPTVSTSIPAPVTDNQWGEALNERVLWMTGSGIQRAEIRLQPAELGPISVQVSVDEDAAQVTFVAQHATTREAIEAAMPRLRELLLENGLSLAGSTVADSEVAERNQESTGESIAAATADAEASTDQDEEEGERRESSALVDTFA